MPAARSWTQIMTWSMRVSMPTARGLAGLAGRVVAVVDRQLEVLLRLVGPELRDRREGVDDRVLQLAALALHLADVDVLDRVAPLVELQRPARGVGDLDLAERGHELLALLHVAADQLRGLVDPARARVTGLREVRRHLAILLAVVRHELPVGRRVDRGAEHEGRDVAESLVAEVGKDGLVHDHRTSDHRELPVETRVPVLGREAERGRYGQDNEVRVGLALDLAEIGCQIVGAERCPQLLDNLAPRLLEAPLEPTYHLVPEGVVASEHRDLLVAQGLRHVRPEGVRRLAPGPAEAHDPLRRLPLG